MTDSGNGGSIDYNAGFRLRWDPEGLKIVTTDYHAAELSLSWDMLFDLAKKADYTVGVLKQAGRSFVL